MFGIFLEDFWWVFGSSRVSSSQVTFGHGNGCQRSWRFQKYLVDNPTGLTHHNLMGQVQINALGLEETACILVRMVRPRIAGLSRLKS